MNKDRENLEENDTKLLVADCPNCSVPIILHRIVGAGNMIYCPYCGELLKVSDSEDSDE